MQIPMRGPLFRQPWKWRLQATGSIWPIATQKQKKKKIKMHIANNFKKNIIMHPAQPSKARLGGVHLIFHHIQILTRLLQVELFRGYFVYCMHI